MPQIDPSDPEVAKTIVLDLHDLVTILLYEYQHALRRYRYSKLLEVVDGSTLPLSLSVDEMKPWFWLQTRTKSGYLVLDPEEEPPEDAPIVEPSDFLHPSYIVRKILDTEDVETIYWRVKLLGATGEGSLLYTVQSILKALTSAVTIRIRTSQGHSHTCPAHAFKIVRPYINHHEGIYIGQILPYIDDSWLKPRRRREVEHQVFGEIPYTEDWLYMVFKNDDPDKEDVALDLSSLIIGSRGLGGEIFALETEGTYREKILSKGGYVVYDSDEEEQVYERVDPAPAESDFGIPTYSGVTHLVLERLGNIINGEEVFCSYCGKPGSPSRCAKCASARYCGKACQKKAWRYHKVWCKVDAVKDAEKQAPTVSKDDQDVAMS